ncbi:MAG TPA: hypothetical protein VGT00_11650 [Methylomirabilota bacterium]|nr:hypothetical protein [Methylomirabilota bacterium]
MDRAASLILPRAPRSPHSAPDPANRLDLILDVCQDGPIAVSLQPLVNEGAQHHLEAYRPLESGRGRSGEDPSPIQDLLGNDKKNPGLVLEHRQLPFLPV